MATKASYISEVPTLNPTESQLRMMLKQIQTIGQTIYDVYGVNYGGEAKLLGSTTKQTLSIEGLTPREIGRFEFYHVIARYEKLESLNSQPSESIQVECDACTRPIEIPAMAGWTKVQVEEWAKQHGIVVEFKTEPSTTVEPDTVLRVEPSEGLIFPEDSLIVTLAKKELTVPDYRESSNYISLYNLWATQEKITMVVQEVFHPTVPKGEIISMSQEVGTIIKPGDTLTLIVSKGAEPQSAPQPSPEENSSPNEGETNPS